jgi:hypothetical protein
MRIHSIQTFAIIFSLMLNLPFFASASDLAGEGERAALEHFLDSYLFSPEAILQVPGLFAYGTYLSYNPASQYNKIHRGTVGFDTIYSGAPIRPNDKLLRSTLAPWYGLDAYVVTYLDENGKKQLIGYQSPSKLLSSEGQMVRQDVYNAPKFLEKIKSLSDKELSKAYGKNWAQFARKAADGKIKLVEAYRVTDKQRPFTDAKIGAIGGTALLGGSLAISGYRAITNHQTKTDAASGLSQQSIAPVPAAGSSNSNNGSAN